MVTTADRRESNAAVLYGTAKGTLDDGDLAMTGADGMADVVPLLPFRWR